MAYRRTEWEEGTTAVSAQNLNNIEDGIEEALAASKGNVDLWSYIRNLVYPVGSIYMSVNNRNPSEVFGGEWEEWGSGRVPVGVNASDNDFIGPEKKGGNKDASLVSHSHTFTGNALPNHGHTFSGNKVGNHTHAGPNHTHGLATSDSGDAYLLGVPKSPDNPVVRRTEKVMKEISSSASSLHPSYVTLTNFLTSGNAVHRMNATKWGGTNATGGGGEHTPSGSISQSSAGTPSGRISTDGSSATSANLQPYITCYMWKRIA